MTSVLAQNLSSPGQGKEHPALFLRWAMEGQSLGGQGRGLTEQSRMDDCPGVIRAAARAVLEDHTQPGLFSPVYLPRKTELKLNTDCGSQVQSKAWWHNQTVVMEARFYPREHKCCYDVKLAFYTVTKASPVPSLNR